MQESCRKPIHSAQSPTSPTLVPTAPGQHRGCGREQETPSLSCPPRVQTMKSFYCLPTSPVLYLDTHHLAQQKKKKQKKNNPQLTHIHPSWNTGSLPSINTSLGLKQYFFHATQTTELLGCKCFPGPSTVLNFSAQTQIVFSHLAHVHPTFEWFNPSIFLSMFLFKL